MSLMAAFMVFVWCFPSTFPNLLPSPFFFYFIWVFVVGPESLFELEGPWICLNPSSLSFPVWDIHNLYVPNHHNANIEVAFYLFWKDQLHLE